MAGFGKKLFYGIVTLVLGFFAVLPLTVYAVITFWLAVGWLSLMILVKGAGVVQRSLKHWWKGDDRNSPEAIAERNRAAALAKREARSRSGSFSQSSASTHSRSQSNRSNRSGSSVSLVSLPYNPPQIDRDYEGVGGWLIPRDNNDHNSNAIIDNDSDSRAPSSSRRPDTTPTTFRRRSFGASSSGINSPEILSTPSLPRHSTSTSLSRQAGSPQSYFINNAPAARSTTSGGSRRNSNSRRNSRATRTNGSTDERT